jgi:pimeloyl-ACP methyl ester carboxylesterase
MVLFLFMSSALADSRQPWSRVVLSGGSHLMMGFTPPELSEADTLNIFIEGDGTPGVALDLAQQIGGNTVYLARPCQYMLSNLRNSCNKALWTSHRFSEDVIRSMDRAVTAMKLRFHAQKVRLIGYSGGGAIASILSSRRTDVSLLITVAGNLDHQRWTDFNHSEPLSGSLNPVDFGPGLELVPQIHLVGERDDVVPGSVLTSYLGKLKYLDNVKSYIIQGADHTCCWSMALASVMQSNLAQ